MVHGHLLFLLIFQQEALHPAFRLFRPARGNAEVALVQFPVPYLLVDDPQRLGILSGDDDAAEKIMGNCFTLLPVLRSMRLHSAGVKAFSHLGFHSRF